MAKFSNLKKHTIIPMGSHCMLAFNLKRLDLIKENLGFEWINTDSLNSFTKLINNNFKDLFAKNLTYKDSNVIDSYYNVRSPHDYKSEQHFIDNPQFIGQLYKKRLLRLKKILSEEKNVVFIRYHNKQLDNNALLELINLIKSKYPNLNFIFFLILQKKMHVQIMDIDEVHYFYHKHTLRYRLKIKFLRIFRSHFVRGNQWKGDAIAWNKILKNIDKIVKTRFRSN